MTDTTRRDLLKGLGAAALVGCGTDADPTAQTPDAATDTGPSIDMAEPTPEPDIAEEPVQPAIQPVRGDGSHPFHYIDTVVIVQMENRTFDHYFGSLSLDEGRTDVNGLLAPMSNKASDGTVMPVRKLGSETVIDPDPPHGHKASLVQFGAGAMDGFILAWEPRLGGLLEKRDLVMGYYTREQLPVYYALADEFTLADRWHASLLAPTWPNRFYSHCATSDGLWSNGTNISAPTPYAPLMADGHSFGVYHGSAIYFPLLLESLPYDSYPAKNLDWFFEDAENGDLPNVSVIEPIFSVNDDHPPADVLQGQVFVSSIYEALRQSPHWENCLMLVFYDEHGGFYDHQPPEKAKGETRAAEGFDQLGFRVPGLAIGPMTQGGKVFSEPVDHSSLPKLIADIFGQEPINERAKLAGDLGGVLDLGRVERGARTAPRKLPEVPVSMRAMEEGLMGPSRQPELWQFAHKGGLAHEMTVAKEIARLNGWLRHVERLGVGRIRP